MVPVMARSTGTQPGVTPDGALIEDLRQRRGLSRAQLSQMTFLKPNTIQKIELYDMNVSILSASRIALALGLERYEDLLKPQPDALAGLDTLRPRRGERRGR